MIKTARTVRSILLPTMLRFFLAAAFVAGLLGWIELHILFHLGVSPDVLVKRYARQCRRAARHMPISKESEQT